MIGLFASRGGAYTRSSVRTFAVDALETQC